MFEKEEKRKICEGCATGNYFLCSSFPGQAPKAAAREIAYRRRKSRRVEAPKQVQIFRRDEDGVE